MVEYAGYAMPVQYQGVLAEHEAVRERVGLFDITHMGEILVTGPGAEAWLNSLVTNRIAGIALGKIVYNAMCRPDGGILDDMLVYRLGEEEWLVVCNAANHGKIVEWLGQRCPAGGVEIQDQSLDTALIAIQGPSSGELIRRLTDLAGRIENVAALEFYTSFTHDGPHGRWLVSRTGYTGEHGFELYLPNADAVAVWEELMEKGQDLGVAPIGLAARDTLRFEVCYCLYGHELGEDITPLEAGIGWAVKLKKDDVVGQAALREQKAAGVPRRLICLEMDGRGIARQDTRVLCDGVEIGRVTSGTFSPTFKKALAIALVDSVTAKELPEGRLTAEIRGKEIECHQVAFPFLASRTKGDASAPREIS